VFGHDWVLGGGRYRRMPAVPRGAKRHVVVALSVIGCVWWLAFAASGVAAASNAKHYKTRISVGRSGSELVGKLRSSKAACRRGRLVYGVYSSPQFAGGNLPGVHTGAHGQFALSLAAVPSGSWKVTIFASPKKLSAHSSCSGASTTRTLTV
jgi:hypothetical protein